MKLLYAQSNLERVLEQENFDKLSFKYYDNSQIIPEIGMTNADYMNRVVKSCLDFVKNFDSEHDNLLFYRQHRCRKDLSNQLYCQKADGQLSFSDLFFRRRSF